MNTKPFPSGLNENAVMITRAAFDRLAETMLTELPAPLYTLVLPPSGVTNVPAGQADERLLRVVDRAIRDEVEATVGRRSNRAASALFEGIGARRMSSNLELVR